MDAQSLDLPDESFDVVLCGFVLHIGAEPYELQR
ncbi:methyltransferase domain-containing protein [Saccharopolyspora sp. NPDC000359]